MKNKKYEKLTPAIGKLGDLAFYESLLLQGDKTADNYFKRTEYDTLDGDKKLKAHVKSYVNYFDMLIHTESPDEKENIVHFKILGAITNYYVGNFKKSLYLINSLPHDREKLTYSNIEGFLIWILSDYKNEWPRTNTCFTELIDDVGKTTQVFLKSKLRDKDDFKRKIQALRDRAYDSRCDSAVFYADVIASLLFRKIKASHYFNSGQLRRGNGDHSGAVEQYFKGAEYDCSECKLRLAVAYRDGKGVEQNYKQSVYWLRLAVEHGHIYAQECLATAYEDGQGFRRNYNKAIELWENLVERGSVRAIYKLACIYHWGGKGVEKDYEKSQKLFKEAKELGCDTSGMFIDKSNKKGKRK